MRTLHEELEDIDADVITFDGLDGAALGVAERFGLSPFLIYDYDMCINALENKSDQDAENRYLEAVEHFNYNVVGAYVGESTPGFLKRFKGSHGYTILVPHAKSLWDDMDQHQRHEMVKYIKRSYCTRCMSLKSKCSCSER